MRIKLSIIVLITVILFATNAIMVGLFDHYYSHIYQKAQAKHTLETMINAHTALIYSQQEDAQHFPTTYNLISHAYNEGPDIHIDKDDSKPQQALSTTQKELVLSAKEYQLLLSQLITKHFAQLTTPFHFLNDQWVTITGTLHRHPLWPYFLATIIFNLLTLIILWLCFMLYYRRTLPSKILNLFQGQNQDDEKLDPIMANLRERIHAYFDEKTLMINALAHDIRTPLTAAMLRLEFLDDQEAAKPIINSLDSIKNIIHSSLEFSQPHHKLTKSSADIISLLETIAEPIQDDQFHIHVKSSMTNYELNIEIELFKRMVMNILENARKYATECVIHITHKPKKLIMEFIDNGMGVPEKYHDNLTTPYFRVDPSRSSDTGGSGLGLAVVKKVAELHQGYVTFENQPNQGGFKVTITLKAPI